MSHDLDHLAHDPEATARPLTAAELARAGPWAARAGMAAPHVVVQMGHVARTTGATGTRWEQQAAREIAGRVAEGLRRSGVAVSVTGADDPVPGSDVFVALHCDGSTDPSRRGASAGWPDEAGRLGAAEWKRAHQRHGYAWGFHPDNYTVAMRRYYGFRRSSAPVRWLAEHATTTNDEDLTWLASHLDDAALAHVEAISAVLGIPGPPPQEEDDDMARLVRFDDGGIWVTDGVTRRQLNPAELAELERIGLGGAVVNVSEALRSVPAWATGSSPTCWIAERAGG
ncbi:MAG: N-acetylmuramoyl-L-alanine amidase [Acidimicrobiales bacterium]